MNTHAKPASLARAGHLAAADARYMSGFGNSFETETLPGALPIGRNSPQKPAYGLYAEQLSGSPFTAPQATNQRSWLYRINPSVKHTRRFRKAERGNIRSAGVDRGDTDASLGQLRWDPMPLPKCEAFVRRGAVDHHHRRRRRGAGGHGGAYRAGDAVDGR